MSKVFAWMSFVDPDRPAGQRFLGVVVTRATIEEDTMTVLDRLRDKGLNPGGECQPQAMRGEAPIPEEFIDRLLTKEEAEALDDMMRAAFEGRKLN